MLSVFSKINVQECDSTFDSRIFYLFLMIVLIFLKCTKELVTYSKRAKWSHILFWCIYHLSHIWVFLTQVSYLWSLPKRFSFDILRIESSSCPALAFSFLFFLAGQSVLRQHFLGELLFCGNQAIFKFCGRVIFNFIYLLVILSLTMHSGWSGSIFPWVFVSSAALMPLLLAAVNGLTPFRKDSPLTVLVSNPVRDTVSLFLHFFLISFKWMCWCCWIKQEVAVRESRELKRPAV